MAVSLRLRFFRSLKLVIFGSTSTKAYRLWVSCERNFSYNSQIFFFLICRCFCQSLKMCMSFNCNPQVILVTLFAVRTKYALCPRPPPTPRKGWEIYCFTQCTNLSIRLSDCASQFVSALELEKKRLRSIYL